MTIFVYFKNISSWKEQPLGGRRMSTFGKIKEEDPVNFLLKTHQFLKPILLEGKAGGGDD
jgi:hypothetical protein